MTAKDLQNGRVPMPYGPCRKDGRPSLTALLDTEVVILASQGEGYGGAVLQPFKGRRRGVTTTSEVGLSVGPLQGVTIVRKRTHGQIKGRDGRLRYVIGGRITLYTVLDVDAIRVRQDVAPLMDAEPKGPVRTVKT